MTRLYLDVDGVLVGKLDPRDVEVGLASHAAEFLKFVLAYFEPMWLSTHTHDGDPESAVRYLRPYADSAALDLIRQIRPAKFKTLKVELLAENEDSYWVDDAPLGVELSWLKEHGLVERWIPCDTRKNPDDLLRIMDILRERLAEGDGKG